MESGLGETSTNTPPRAAEPQLRLLTELPPRHHVFFGNLRDTLLRRNNTHVWTTSPPGKFWPDVFVPTGLPWFRLTESGILHVLAVLMLVTFTNLYFALQRPQIKLKPQTAITDYEISEYLPPINTGSPPAPKPRKGQPLLAKQEIISLPPRPDNFEQTIVSPVDVKLPSNVPLPNIVAWTNTPGPLRAEALRNQAKLTLPPLPASVIAPPTDTQNLSPSRSLNTASNVIGPAPDAQNLNTQRKLDVAANVIGPPPTDDAKLRTPRALIAVTPSVIAPPPDTNVSRNIGAMNVGQITPTVAAPKLEVAAQRAIPQATAVPTSGNGQGGTTTAGSNGSTGAAPPVPVIGALNNGPASGQLIALNLHPATATGPVNVPPGRRTGEFAAGPTGKPDAPGTPEIKGGGNGAGGNGTGSAGPGKGGDATLPAGIVVGNAPGAPPPGSVVVSGTPQKANSNAPKFGDTAKEVLMASAHPPRVGEVPHDNSPTSSAPSPSRIEDKIFSGKKYYSMTLNMPNLASAGGSWVIRFAQLDNDKTVGDLSAPVATSTVDPKYPPDLIRDGIEGTVILYAVIHKDGTVGEVRVLRGLQGKLDENARIALLRWKFRPGTKNGEAVDLEAVVQIPYKAPHLNY